jgi:ferredoxin-type protein NapG
MMSEEVRLKPLLSRRAMVGGAIGVAAMFAVGGASKALAGESDFLRPPGGQDFANFIGACVKCDRCRSACDREAISVCTIRDGMINARLPKMDFRSGRCDMCDGAYKCIVACPTLALAAFNSEQDKIGLAVIDKNECLIYGVSGHCSAPCINSCKWEALALDEADRLVLDQEKCNGCGACEFVCPSDSYKSYSGTGRRGINIEVLQS